MKKRNTPVYFLPIAYEVEAGKTYYWCRCGKTKTLCDRKDCYDKAIPYHATLTETVYFCGCKKTQDPPLCDGSHAKMLMSYLLSRK